MFVISKDLLENLLNYLYSKPCGGVLEGVLALKQLVPYEEYQKLHEPK